MEIDWVDFLVPPLVGALVGFGVWYFQSRLEALRREQERLHDDRRKVYADVLEPFVRIFAGIRNPKENQKALKHMLSVEYKRTAFEFSLIGADDVVKSFNALMQYVYSLDAEAEEKPDPTELIRLWGAFLLEIRRNVGDPKTKLLPVDMLRSQITDIDTIIG
jgi:hypothetical protein